MFFKLNPEDREALQEYWRFYEPRSAVISKDVRRRAADLPEWKPILETLSSDQIDERERRSQQLQRNAIVEDRWDPYLEDLRAQGIQYAEAGVSYSGWFDLIRLFRDSTRQLMATERHLPKATTAEHGMYRMLDIAVQSIGEAYLATKQQLVARAEERYRAMFEHVPVPMWLFDRETLRFIAVNEAAIRHYGYSRDEFAAMTLADIRPPEDVAALRANIGEATGLLAPALWRHQKKDGSIISVQIAANDFVEAGKPVRLVVVSDVTARELAENKLRKTEGQLRQAQKMDAIGRLAGGVAHDFNNLLTVIESYAWMLEESFDPNDRRRDDVCEIRRASERATGITRQLLTLSRHSIVEPRSMNLDDLVAKFIPMLRRLVGEQVTVVTHQTETPPVVADPGQMEQVIMNLAVNARDAMPSGGRLTIETMEETLDEDQAAMRSVKPGHYVVLAVTDTGTGMDAQTQARIFDPFFTTKEPDKGTGLGLSIVHGIVSQAGGCVSAYSELGHGTTFRIHLPVSSETVVDPERSPVEAPRTLPAMTVLVVDDQREVRTVAARVLQEAGCHTIEAATAEEARRMCVTYEGSIDVVVLDVVLADGRGDRFVHQLRELRPLIKVVMMSGYPAGALSPTGAAPHNLLAKPFSPSLLRAAVARVIGAEPPRTITGRLPLVREAKDLPRVLVVDDDDHLRKVIGRILRKLEIDVVEVDNGRTAIKELEARPFDVVLSDVQMPGGGGLDLMRAIRGVDLDVPIILMSGAPDVTSAATAIEYGAFRYLTKPIDTDVLGKTIHHAIRVHALARIRREAFAVSGAQTGAADRVGLEVQFDQALEQLWMAFQPIFDSNTGALYGVEALVRSGEVSMSNPNKLLDAATQLARLPQLGRKVRALSAAALTDRSDLVLFVNLHPDDLSDVELLDESSPLTRIASRVVLEVTERASLVNSPELSARLARLRKLGFRLAVDDIGAGYSGLTSFTELVPEVVKIDMSLVRDVHKSALKQRTVAALCRLCKEVGCLVVGEGVETLDERECLVALGCDLLQGYVLGRPERTFPPKQNVIDSFAAVGLSGRRRFR
ncbi:MAG: EAL domain-containing protein [Deltaproteobacteria bacterium]|nr:EAL domain-containing protein [Deltaproteobacteria bacterium]